ncbi:hypothetical protein EGI16_12935 [Chryseobacterium sp. G0240]|uniref:hypothetical protein n=1 Tax=Chryseobacterium sp. G0240 TaxID=2487066 RepID=UPI000F45DFAF|nr:hypothetical protein [Chryseobacterium sp. G0240]ROI02538.1 hypothetical protein EGI16_12935 [Chryseobacterium sp. G0240]
MERVKHSAIPEGSEYRKKLTPEKVVNILGKHGTKVSAEEAEIILQFMRKIADVAVNQYLYDKKD